MLDLEFVSLQGKEKDGFLQGTAGLRNKTQYHLHNVETCRSHGARRAGDDPPFGAIWPQGKSRCNDKNNSNE
jgi:hypothetical protein